jgi:hypothetical protein
MKKGMEVKIEKLPTRCEVCHQSDFFDPISKKCNRCGELEKLSNEIGKEKYQLLAQTQNAYLTKLTMSGGLLGFISGYLIFYGLFVMFSRQEERRIILNYYPEVIPICMAIVGSFLTYLLSKLILTETFLVKNILLLNRLMLLSMFSFWGMMLGYLFVVLNNYSPRYSYPIPPLLGCLLGLFVYLLFANKFFVKRVSFSSK